MFEKKMYINGELVGDPKQHDVFCPATNKKIGSVAWAGKEETYKTLESASDAFDSWSNTPIKERIDWMMKLRDEVIANESHLRECIHLEMGKPWDGTQEDIDSLKNSLTFYSEEILKREPESLLDKEGTHSHILKDESVGVVVAFIAWNFPLLNLAFKIGPAMATGCPIIIKPSFKSPLSAYAVGELCAKIGLPKGAVNFICGDDKVVGDTLSSSPIPALLTLIGSINTGKHIMKMGSSTIKRYSMELGGNAPVIVFDDANLELAADIITALKFGNAGQICVTPNRVFVADNIKEEIVNLIVDRAKKIKVGHNKDEDINMGPLIDEMALSRVTELVNDAIQNGAKLLHGGKKPDEFKNDGYFYEPTVIDNVKTSMRVFKEEVFGPVISICNFNDEDEIINEANNTDAGLTAYVFTEDQSKADHCANKLRFGEIQINGVKYNIDLPHIGIKQSGIGCDCSHLALNDYLVPKRITRTISKAS